MNRVEILDNQQQVETYEVVVQEIEESDEDEDDDQNIQQPG